MSVESCDLIAKISSNSSEVSVSLMEKNGTIRQKSVSIDELVSQLVSSHQISTDILPRGTRFYKGGASDYTIGIELAPKRRPIQISSYDGTTRKVVPVPRCLFIARIRNKQFYKSWLFSLASPFNKWNETLYSFPFGNVYDGGSICWGSAYILEVRRPMDLIAVLSSFFDSTFNGDLVEGYAFERPDVEYGEEEVRGLWPLVSYLENMDVFPNDMLYRKSFNVDDVIEGRV